jgi:hypothetical protein
VTEAASAMLAASEVESYIALKDAGGADNETAGRISADRDEAILDRALGRVEDTALDPEVSGSEG